MDVHAHAHIILTLLTKQPPASHIACKLMSYTQTEFIDHRTLPARVQITERATPMVSTQLNYSIGLVWQMHSNTLYIYANKCIPLLQTLPLPRVNFQLYHTYVANTVEHYNITAKFNRSSLGVYTVETL